MKTVKGRLNNSMSSAVRNALVNSKARRSWESLVGYTVEQLKEHLEKKFTPEMTWENYGAYWEIDHHIPISAFNFQSNQDVDFQKCWKLKNLRPLGKDANRSKGSRVEKPFQPSLAIGGKL